MPPPPPRSPRRRLLRLAVLVAGLAPGVGATAGTAGAAEAGMIARSPEAAVPLIATAVAPSATNPFAGRRLYRAPAPAARAQARSLRRARPGDAALVRRVAMAPAAVWLGDWTPDVRAAAARLMRRARATRSLPVVVAYNIPERDLGLHSSGGASGSEGYLAWIDGLAAGLGDGPAAVVLEPDALAALDGLPEETRAGRSALIAQAVARLAGRPGIAVYIDAGNASWIPAPEMAARLRAAGVGQARGFAVNVSNFHSTARSRDYGRAISRLVGGAPFVIDTSRNGAGPAPDGAWCNPPGRALGAAPTWRTGDPAVDAFLWVKRPGESDGECNGGPPAGGWWADEALRLARAAGG